MQTNINVQALTVEAALTGKREHIYHAAMLDPHTAAELDPDQITALVDDLIEAHGEMLPKYYSMIHYNSETQTFNLLLATSVYAFQVDENGRLVHLAWGSRPAGAADDDVIDGRNGYEASVSVASFERQAHCDELLAFGDVTYHEVSLKASFASLPGAPAAHEALHLPLRDVRLRYAGHEIVVGAQPGLAPAHGLPTSDSSPARRCA